MEYLFLLGLLICAVWARVEHLQKNKDDIHMRSQDIGFVQTIAQIATVSFVIAVGLCGYEAGGTELDASRFAELFVAVSWGWLFFFGLLFIPYAVLWGLALVVDVFLSPQEAEQELEADDSFLGPY